MSTLWAVSAGLFAASAAVVVAWWWLEVRRPSSKRLRVSHARAGDAKADKSGLRDFSVRATPVAAPSSGRRNPRAELGYSPPADPESSADFPSPT